MTVPVRIGLVGTGAMGTHHARVVAESTAATLTVVLDTDAGRAEHLADAYGAISAADLESLAAACDAVVVASATPAHLEIALTVMALGRPVLVEKPLAPTAHEVDIMLAAARQHGVALMGGFVERHNPVVTTAQQILEDAPIHVVALRHSSDRATAYRATASESASVVHDLLIHDIDLAIRFAATASMPPGIHSVLWPRGGFPQPTIADCLLQFGSGMIATLSASRVSQQKTRLLRLTTPTVLCELDLLRQDLTVYRHLSHEWVRGSDYRSATSMDIPFVRQRGEPLALQFAHFLDLVNGRADADQERASLLLPHLVADAVANEYVTRFPA